MGHCDQKKDVTALQWQLSCARLGPLSAHGPPSATHSRYPPLAVSRLPGKRGDALSGGPGPTKLGVGDYISSKRYEGSPCDVSMCPAPEMGPPPTGRSMVDTERMLKTGRMKHWMDGNPLRVSREVLGTIDLDLSVFQVQLVPCYTCLVFPFINL